jgi:hypothetical protein
MVFRVAASTSSGARRTAVLREPAPAAFTARLTAAAETW